MKIYSNNEGNDLINLYFRKDKPFIVGRIGISEMMAVNSYIKNSFVDNGICSLLANNAGVYGNCCHKFIIEYIDSIKDNEFHVFWDLKNEIETQKQIFNKYSSNSIIISNRAVEPFHFEKPWSINLQDKKVLVISPFADSIQYQYKNKDKIWKNKEILPFFNLITYSSVQSIGNQGPHSDWMESLAIMKDEISKIDFDVALLGCGAYGMPLASFINKKLKKTSIYVGGSLQILFGIKGKRWDVHPDVNKYYNEFWIRPTDKETPSNFHVVEGGTYW